MRATMLRRDYISAAFRRMAVVLLGCLLWPALLPARDYTVGTVPNVRLSDRTNHVSNPDGIILPEDAGQINRLLRMVEDSLGIEVAVVAVEGIGEEEPRMFATDLFKHWGLGKKQQDNGLLILLVTDPAQRTVVFETGYGLEGILPDAICYRLQQRYMVPDLKEGNYSTGMLKGVAAVSNHLLTGGYERSAQEEDDETELLLAAFGMALCCFLVIGLLLYLTTRPRPCPRCGRKTFQKRGRVTIQSPTYHSSGYADDIYRCSACGYEERRRHTLPRLQRDDWRGPGVGGGTLLGGGGSFGGFSGGGSWGGGSSGGGGAASRF